MKDIILIMILSLSSYLLIQSYYLWQSNKMLDKQNSVEKNDIKDSELYLEHLKPLPTNEIKSINYNYQILTTKVNEFSHIWNMKVSVKFKDLNKNISFEKIASSSHEGISELPIRISFFGLEDINHVIPILKFVEKLEKCSAIRIQSVIQKGNVLEVQLKLYGRAI